MYWKRKTNSRVVIEAHIYTNTREKAYMHTYEYEDEYNNFDQNVNKCMQTLEKICGNQLVILVMHLDCCDEDRKRYKSEKYLKMKVEK